MKKLLLIGVLLSFFLASPARATEEPTLKEAQLMVELIQTKMGKMNADYQLLKQIALPDAQKALQKAIMKERNKKKEEKKDEAIDTH